MNNLKLYPYLEPDQATPTRAEFNNSDYITMGNKSQQNFERREDLKKRFRHLSSESIASRLLNFSKSNDIAVAYKQILKERDIDDYLIYIDSLKNS